jgi:hypothetical protein
MKHINIDLPGTKAHSVISDNYEGEPDSYGGDHSPVSTIRRPTEARGAFYSSAAETIMPAGSVYAASRDVKRELLWVP